MARDGRFGEERRLLRGGLRTLAQGLLDLQEDLAHGLAMLEAVAPPKYKVSSSGEVEPIAERGERGEAGPQGVEGRQGPEGRQGERGERGEAGLEWRGAWAAGTTYRVHQAVDRNGSSYIAIREGIGHEPPNAEYWELLAEKGERGTAGAEGREGPSGASVWQTILFGQIGLNAETAAGTYNVPGNGGTVVRSGIGLEPASTGAKLPIFDWIKASDYQVAGKKVMVRVTLTLVTNEIGPGVTLTASLVPVTGATGAERVVHLTGGSGIARAVIVTPAASSRVTAASASVELPAENFYELLLTLSAATAAKSAVWCTVKVQVRNE